MTISLDEMFWKSPDIFINRCLMVSMFPMSFFDMISTFLMCFGQLGRSDLRHVTCAADLPGPANITSDSNLDIAVFDPRKRRYKAANGPKQGPFGTSEGKPSIDLSGVFIIFKLYFYKIGFVIVR